MRNTLLSIAKSWYAQEGTKSMEEISDWIEKRNQTVKVDIRKNPEGGEPAWFYDQTEGCIRNAAHSFFTIAGIRREIPGRGIVAQPVVLQLEISYLGILCREINGVMHFLMQGKIEPGNVNCVQISPTLQATKSNFTQKHGGAKPPYLEYFINASKYEVVVDQIQSEQASRFYRKRNRNILIRVDEDVPVLPSHCWMTLGQIKQFMRRDNMVNMDARTVLSCIPYAWLRLSPLEMLELSDHFTDKPLFRSVFAGSGDSALPRIYGYINDQKMFTCADPEIVPLHTLPDWEIREGEWVCKHRAPFKIIFCDIAIEGREVKQWTQPLLEATGIATFGLICCEEDGILKFLVRAMPEIGCFDGLELGPTVQREATDPEDIADTLGAFFQARLRSGEGIVFDHLLSEEGGRFYHEQNRNVLLRVKKAELPPLPEGYFLLDYRTLNELVQTNNVLNIQLRNLLALLEA